MKGRKRCGHHPPRPESCRLCWNEVNDPTYASHWASAPLTVTELRAVRRASKPRVALGSKPKH